MRPKRRVRVERPRVGCSTMRLEVRHRVPMRSRSEVVFMGRMKGALGSAFPDETTMGVSTGWNKGSWGVFYEVFGKRLSQSKINSVGHSGEWCRHEVSVRIPRWWQRLAEGSFRK